MVCVYTYVIFKKFINETRDHTRIILSVFYNYIYDSRLQTAIINHGERYRFYKDVRDLR